MEQSFCRCPSRLDKHVWCLARLQDMCLSSPACKWPFLAELVWVASCFILFQTYHQSHVNTENEKHLGLHYSFFTSVFLNADSSSQMVVSSWPHTYQILGYLKWEQLNTNATCWPPQSDSKTVSDGFLNTLEIYSSTMSTSVNNSGRWLSLTFDLLSSICFLQQKEQTPISAILTWFKQLPLSHSRASRMHHSCTVVPWGFEQVWKGAGKLRAQQKQRHTAEQRDV